MKELFYTVLELEEFCRGTTCWFCFNKSVCQIRTRSKSTGEILANDMACQNCKERFENDELPKCDNCGKLKNKHKSNICDCVGYNETQEKELPSLPQQRESMSAFYERQISALQEKEIQLTEEVDIHLEALDVSKEWHQRQKQELLDEIAKLKEEIKQLKTQNTQTAQIESKPTKKPSFPFFRKT